jgi:hypothetical protein
MKTTIIVLLIPVAFLAGAFLGVLAREQAAVPAAAPAGWGSMESMDVLRGVILKSCGTRLS